MHWSGGAEEELSHRPAFIPAREWAFREVLLRIVADQMRSLIPIVLEFCEISLAAIIRFECGPAYSRRCSAHTGSLLFFKLK